jgi:hypothetical protein
VPPPNTRSRTAVLLHSLPAYSKDSTAACSLLARFARIFRCLVHVGLSGSADACPCSLGILQAGSGADRRWQDILDGWRRSPGAGRAASHYCRNLPARGQGALPSSVRSAGGLQASVSRPVCAQAEATQECVSRYQLRASFVEVYRERAYDLLKAVPQGRTALRLREGEDGSVHVGKSRPRQRPLHLQPILLQLQLG